MNASKVVDTLFHAGPRALMSWAVPRHVDAIRAAVQRGLDGADTRQPFRRLSLRRGGDFHAGTRNDLEEEILAWAATAKTDADKQHVADEVSYALGAYAVRGERVGHLATPFARPKVYLFEDPSGWFMLMAGGAAVDRRRTRVEAVDLARKTWRIPPTEPVYEFREGAFVPSETITPGADAGLHTDWHDAGRAFVAAERLKRHKVAEKRGKKAKSATDHEIDETLAQLHEILNERPTRETEERFKGLKLHYLDITAGTKAARVKRVRAIVDDTDPKTMSAGKINTELDAVSALRSQITDEFIAAGRGYERPSDWQDKTDPLSLRAKVVSDRIATLIAEIEYRAGSRARRLSPRDPLHRARTKEGALFKLRVGDVGHGVIGYIREGLDYMRARPLKHPTEEDAADEQRLDAALEWIERAMKEGAAVDEPAARTALDVLIDEANRWDDEVEQADPRGSAKYDPEKLQMDKRWRDAATGLADQIMKAMRKAGVS